MFLNALDMMVILLGGCGLVKNEWRLLAARKIMEAAQPGEQIFSAVHNLFATLQRRLGTANTGGAINKVPFDGECFNDEDINSSAYMQKKKLDQEADPVLMMVPCPTPVRYYSVCNLPKRQRDPLVFWSLIFPAIRRFVAIAVGQFT